MFDNLLWTKLNTLTPQTRLGHTLVHYNNALYLLGGAIDASLTNELWKYSQQRWEKIVASNPPSRRCGHTAVVKDDNMFVFGGEDDGSEEEVNEVHRFDFKRQKWTKLLIKSEYIPDGRDGHSAVVYGDEMIVFGGYNADLCELGSVESLDLKKHVWKRVNCKGMEPRRRYYHSACVYESKMYIFGGLASEFDSVRAYSDLFALDLRTHKWEQLSVTFPFKRACVNNDKIAVEKDYRPSASYGHSACARDGYMIIYGGTMINNTQVHIYDLKNDKWSIVNTIGDKPPGTYLHALTLADDGIYLFGGKGSDSSLYKLELPSNRCLTCMLEIYNQQIFADLVLIVEKQRFPVHKCIISQSDVLQAIFTSVEQKDKIQEVPIQNVSIPVMQKILQYLYSGNIELTKNDHNIYVELIIAADEYELQYVVGSCLSQFDAVVQVNNMLDILEKAYQHKLEPVKQLCFNMFLKYRDTITKQKKIHNLPTDLMVELLRLSEEKPVLQNMQPSMGVEILRQHIAMLYKRKIFSDVTLITNDNKKHAAHKIILMAFCEYFALMFKSMFKESFEEEIKLEDVDSEILELVLKYIYIGKCVSLPQDHATLMKVCRFADKYLMRELRELAKHQLITLVSRANALEIALFCIEFRIDGELRQKSLKYLNKAQLVEVILECQRRSEAQQRMIKKLERDLQSVKSALISSRKRKNDDKQREDFENKRQKK